MNDLDEAERQMNSNGRVVFASTSSRLASLAAKGAPTSHSLLQCRLSCSMSGFARFVMCCR